MWLTDPAPHDPQFAATPATSTTPIDLTVTWDDGTTERFCADPADALSPYGADLHSRAYAGEFGTVAAHVAGTSLTPPVGWSTALESMEGVAYRSLHTGDTGEYLTGRWWKAPAEDGAFDAGNRFNYDFPSGWYTITGTWSNGPAGTAAVSGVLHVIQRDSSTVRQTQVLYTASGIWWRYGSGSLGSYTWGTWYKLPLIGGADDWSTTGAMVAGQAAARADLGFSPKVQAYDTTSAAALAAIALRASSGGATIALAKSRSTVAGTLGAVQSGDILGDIAVYGDDGTTMTTRAALLRISAPGAPVTGGVPARFGFYGKAVGATSDTEFLRLDENGLSMGGANVVVDSSRIVRARSYTIATLPTVVDGGLVSCSDLGGGSGILAGENGKWRRLSEGGTATVTGDADFTLTPLASAVHQRHTGTLTANRTVTLSATNAYEGAKFRVSRTGSGAFTLSIGGLKSLSTGQWAEVTYLNSAWVLTAYGSL